MKVSEYMSTTTEIATPDTTLSQIAKQLATNNVSCVIIVEDRKPVGKRVSMIFTRPLDL
jgi:CBS domain-containing protein